MTCESLLKHQHPTN